MLCFTSDHGEAMGFLCLHNTQFTERDYVYDCCKWLALALLAEGSLDVKHPTIWTDEKAEVGRVREEERRERRSEKRKSQKKEDAGARNGKKVAKHCVFPKFCGSGGSKSGSLKRPLWREAHFEVKMHIQSTILGALLEVEILKKCTALWHEAHAQVKMQRKNWQFRSMRMWFRVAGARGSAPSQK